MDHKMAKEAPETLGTTSRRCRRNWWPVKTGNSALAVVPEQVGGKYIYINKFNISCIYVHIHTYIEVKNETRIALRDKREQT